MSRYARLFGALVLAVLCLQCQPHAKSTQYPGRVLPRGFPGIELGMTPEQAGGAFLLREDVDPIVSLLGKYGAPDAALKEGRSNESLRKRFFHVEPSKALLPEGVGSGDARSTHGVLYQLGLHYPESYVKENGWRGVTVPYLAQLGSPNTDDGFSYKWEDQRTRIEVALSGSIVNVFYTDRALEKDLTRAEANSVGRKP